MIRVGRELGPPRFPLAHGVTVELGPFDPAADVAGQLAFADTLRDGGDLAAAEAAMILSIAKRRIVAWDGVVDDATGEPIEATPDAVELVFRQVPQLLSYFRGQYLADLQQWSAEGNVSGLSQPGIGGEGRNTAATAAPSASLAPQPSDGAAAISS